MNWGIHHWLFFTQALTGHRSTVFADSYDHWELDTKTGDKVGKGGRNGNKDGNRDGPDGTMTPRGLSGWEHHQEQMGGLSQAQGQKWYGYMNWGVKQAWRTATTALMLMIDDIEKRNIRGKKSKEGMGAENSQQRQWAPLEAPTHMDRSCNIRLLLWKIAKGTAQILDII